MLLRLAPTEVFKSLMAFSSVPNGSQYLPAICREVCFIQLHYNSFTTNACHSKLSSQEMWWVKSFKGPNDPNNTFLDCLVTYLSNILTCNELGQFLLGFCVFWHPGFWVKTAVPMPFATQIPVCHGLAKHLKDPDPP